MTDPIHPDRVPLDPQRVVRPAAYNDFDQGDIFSRWQADIDAGRIGTKLPVDPAIAANRERWHNLIQDLTRDRERLRAMRGY